MGDEEFLRRWQEGDPEAGAALVEKHRAALAAFFRERVPADEAPDLLQDTLLTLVEACSRIRSHTSFRAFAFGVARRKLLEYSRKRKSTPLGDTVAALHSDARSAAALLERKADSNITIAALRSLPLDEQLLLQLSGYQSLKRRELAEVFDVPLGVIGGRLYRARQRLLRTIEKLQDSPADVDSTETSLHAYWSNLGDA